MNDLVHQIKTIARQITPEVIHWRRHLHANPELSYQEYETAKYVKNALESFGLSVHTLATTGLVA